MSNEHPYEKRRIANIYLENDVIGSGMWCFEIAQTLRAYADAVEKQETGQYATGVFDSPGGTRMVITTGTWIGHKSPVQDTFVRPALE